jgi:hypothetical protein
MKTVRITEDESRRLGFSIPELGWLVTLQALSDMQPLDVSVSEGGQAHPQHNLLSRSPRYTKAQA